jgi:hypothetical protein
MKGIQALFKADTKGTNTNEIFVSFIDFARVCCSHVDFCYGSIPASSSTPSGSLSLAFAALCLLSFHFLLLSFHCLLLLFHFLAFVPLCLLSFYCLLLSFRRLLLSFRSSILARDLNSAVFYKASGEFSGVRRPDSGKEIEVRAMRIQYPRNSPQFSVHVPTIRPKNSSNVHSMSQQCAFNVPLMCL